MQSTVFFYDVIFWGTMYKWPWVGYYVNKDTYIKLVYDEIKIHCTFNMVKTFYPEKIGESLLNLNMKNWNHVMCIHMKIWYGHILHNQNCMNFIDFHLVFKKIHASWYFRVIQKEPYWLQISFQFSLPQKQDIYSVVSPQNMYILYIFQNYLNHSTCFNWS